MSNPKPVEGASFDYRGFAVKALHVEKWDPHWIPEHYRDALDHAEAVIREAVEAALSAAPAPDTLRGAAWKAHEVLFGMAYRCGHPRGGCPNHCDLLWPIINRLREALQLAAAPARDGVRCQRCDVKICTCGCGKCPNCGRFVVPPAKEQADGQPK